MPTVWGGFETADHYTRNLRILKFLAGGETTSYRFIRNLLMEEGGHAVCRRSVQPVSKRPVTYFTRFTVSWIEPTLFPYKLHTSLGKQYR